MDDMQQGNIQQGHMQEGDIPKFMHNTFWLDDRISVTFKIVVPPGGQFPPTAVINRGLEVRVQAINAELNKIGFSVSFFGEEVGKGRGQSTDAASGKDASSEGEGNDRDQLPTGVYLFRPPFPVPFGVPIDAKMVSFLRLTKTGAGQPGDTSGGCQDNPQHGPIVRIVNRLNCLLQKEQEPNAHQVSSSATIRSLNSPANSTPVFISSAAPTYLCGATNTQGPISQGCPLSPPIPVPVDASCSDQPGYFPFSLPELPKELQARTGEGVTVFVLDTLPQPDHLKQSAEAAGDTNKLLQDFVSNAKFYLPPFSYPSGDGSSVKCYYPAFADTLDMPGIMQPGTGKDVYGRLIGFDMPDHGLFVAGIIRDLAPKAHIECYRILNDKCTGSVQTLTDVLTKIYERMTTGDLAKQPVVINMSLVIPDDSEVTNQGIDPAILFMAREGLRVVLQNLVDVGAVCVASAGNEGDLRYNPMNKPDVRPNALYPAAYAYELNLNAERMIPVGAANKDGKVTDYSCYPGVKGFATYGGDLPSKADIEDGHGYDMTSVKKIDAPIGLYSSPVYPALSFDDPEPTYPAPNASGWAYWIGTSFATPVMAAVTARAMELAKSHALGVELPDPSPFIQEAATRQTDWTNLGSSTTGASSGSGGTATDAQGLMIWAVQCKPDEDKGEDEQVEVEINITEVNVVYEQ